MQTMPKESVPQKEKLDGEDCKTRLQTLQTLQTHLLLILPQKVQKEIEEDPIDPIEATVDQIEEGLYLIRPLTHLVGLKITWLCIRSSLRMIT
jgi:hypothetical protein